MEHYHLTLDQIRKLTPKQVDTIYFHKRDKNGQLEVKKTDNKYVSDKKTFESEMLGLDQFYASFGNILNINEEKYRSMQQELRVKYGEEEGRT